MEESGHSRASNLTANHWRAEAREGSHEEAGSTGARECCQVHLSGKTAVFPSEGEGYGNFEILWLCNVRASQVFRIKCCSMWLRRDISTKTHAYIGFEDLCEYIDTLVRVEAYRWHVDIDGYIKYSYSHIFEYLVKLSKNLKSVILFVSNEWLNISLW